ncbi:MAG: hypothetical protein HY540_07075 [Deltaproteobacteria bacterium]|nr:hypothetical protein [Deltaproteobacteria bacterium]
MRRIFFKLFCFIFTAVTLSACATITIRAERLVPARHPLADVQSIAIIDFPSFEESEDEIAEKLREHVISEIQQNGFLSVADGHLPPTPTGKRAPTWRDQWKNYGASVHASVVLGGEIDRAGVQTTADGKQGAIVLTTHVLDVATGKILGNDRLIKVATFKYSESDVPDDDDIMNELIKEMSQSIVETVSPRLIGGSVEFLKNPESETGLQLALSGEWASAVASWKEALRHHPESHVLHYNLGAAYEFLELNDLAKFHFHEALQLKKDKRYERAYGRLSQSNEASKQLEKSIQQEDLDEPMDEETDEKPVTDQD